jgi:hypothetical protein
LDPKTTFQIDHKCDHLHDTLPYSLHSYIFSCFSSLAMILIVQEDYINTSHPNFIGGSKAVELAQQQVRSAKMSSSVVRKVWICCLLLLQMLL